MRAPAPSDVPRPRHAGALAPLFVLSGASGLCFEILWARELQVVIGATSRAVTTVVGLFMAGLALGGVLGARWSTRTARPAVAYGMTEVGIGATAALVTLLLPTLEGLPGLPARYVAAALLLVVPSTLMGMTYPLVTAAADPAARRGGGVLYAANTAGAMLGCLLTGFLGIGLLGIRGSGQAAAVVNLLVGLVALVVFGRRTAARPAPTEEPPAALPRPAVTGVPAPRFVLAAAGLAGAGALASEILWTRALLPYVNSSSYAFAAILATYLGGLALGAAAVVRACRRLSTVGLARLLGGLQLGLVVLVALAPRVLGALDTLVAGYVGVRQVTTVGAWLATVAGVFGKTALVVLVPTLLMGASLPLCIALAGRAGMPGGRAAGLTSAVNTTGAIVGSLVAGFVLLPAVGVTTAMVLVGVVHLAAALLVLLPGGAARARLPVALAAVVAVLLALLARPSTTAPFLGRLAAGATLLLVDEGPQDTTAVIARGAGPGAERLILSNGVSYAGDAPRAQRYMGLLGHLPTLLAGDPESALVICVGTGTTASAVALHPEVHALDLVDISPVVHRTLPLFAHVNRSVWTDPRVTIHEADGRQFMGRTPRRYGVVTLEPPPPRVAGAASLYTVELYERARATMAPDGVLAQWLPLHGMTEEETLMLTRAFLQVFPDAALFLLTANEAALLGSPGPLVVDTGRLRERLADPGVRAALGRIGFDPSDGERLAAGLLGLDVVQGPALRALVGPGPVVTDDRPLIEQFAVLLAAGDGPRGDPDGRRGLLRRVLATAGPALPLRGAPFALLAGERAAVTAEVRALVAALASP